MALTVLGAGVSPFVRKVRVFLAEKGLDDDFDPVNPTTAGPEFTEVSPLRRIPAFRDGEPRHAGVAPDAGRWPKLTAFLDRMFGRPSFTVLFEEEAPVFGKRAARLAR